jgi:hypothetical protein
MGKRGPAIGLMGPLGIHVVEDWQWRSRKMIVILVFSHRNQMLGAAKVGN